MEFYNPSVGKITTFYQIEGPESRENKKIALPALKNTYSCVDGRAEGVDNARRPYIRIISPENGVLSDAATSAWTRNDLRSEDWGANERVCPNILAGDYSTLNTRFQSHGPPALSLRGHSMWPRQSQACEWLRLLRFARNDKERNPLQLQQRSLCGARKTSRTQTKKSGENMA
ncbi:MAG: hypothetical protein ABIF19_16980 [Planctomycetota bacterium]